MTPEHLPDWLLCLAYSAFSEEHWASTWYSGGVRSEYFRAWLTEQMTRALQDYEIEDLPIIRKAFAAAAAAASRAKE